MTGGTPGWKTALNSLTMYCGDRINRLTAIAVSPTKSRQFRSALVSAAASRRSVFARATQARTAVSVRSKSRATCPTGGGAASSLPWSPWKLIQNHCQKKMATRVSAGQAVEHDHVKDF